MPVETNYGSINNYGLTEGYILNDLEISQMLVNCRKLSIENFNLQKSTTEQERFFFEENLKKVWRKNIKRD